jgi:PAS domain-containing protein
VGRGSAARAYAASRSFRLRLRFTGALIVLVLPLLAAAWGFGNYAASNERAQTDIRLTSALRTAGSEFGRIVADAQVTAIQLAAERRVQLALRDHDVSALAALRRANPHTRFVIGGHAARRTPGVVKRSADVVVGTHVVGSVVVSVTLDDATLRRLASAAALGHHHDIAVAERRGRVVASSVALPGPLRLSRTGNHTVSLGRTSYRGFAGKLAPETRLHILAPADALDDAASSIRTNIILAGLGVLALVMVLAYALAPALARARVAQQQREVAERVLAHVADGVALLDPLGYVRFWNHAAELITGLPEDAVLGERLEEVVAGWQAAAQQIPIGRPGGREGGGATVPLEFDGRELAVRASLGVATAASGSGVDADELVRNADVAMYVSKHGGKGRLSHFEPAAAAS